VRAEEKKVAIPHDNFSQSDAPPMGSHPEPLSATNGIASWSNMKKKNQRISSNFFSQGGKTSGKVRKMSHGPQIRHLVLLTGRINHGQMPVSISCSLATPVVL
jgi:hypothetical protein